MEIPSHSLTNAVSPIASDTVKQSKLSQMWKTTKITSDAFSDYKRKMALHLKSHMDFLVKTLPLTSEPARKVGFTN